MVFFWTANGIFSKAAKNKFVSIFIAQWYTEALSCLGF